MQNKRKIGTDYERKAGEYLKRQGYEILQYNFYSPAGEIDIVAMHEGYFVFVEVKYRSNNGAGHPLEAVTLGKQQNISKSATYYLKKNQLYDVPVRFDVLSILGDEVQLLQNAFDYRR